MSVKSNVIEFRPKGGASQPVALTREVEMAPGVMPGVLAARLVKDEEKVDNWIWSLFTTGNGDVDFEGWLKWYAIQEIQAAVKIPYSRLRVALARHGWVRGSRHGVEWWHHGDTWKSEEDRYENQQMYRFKS